LEITDRLTLNTGFLGTSGYWDELFFSPGVGGGRVRRSRNPAVQSNRSIQSSNLASLFGHGLINKEKPYFIVEGVE
jgi:hypothetical protein